MPSQLMNEPTMTVTGLYLVEMFAPHTVEVMPQFKDSQ
jgi:hypothetical protein